MDGALAGAELAAPTLEEEGVGFRLSPQQRRLWSLLRQEPGAPYRVGCAVTLRGPLERSGLAAALARVVERHEALRTRFRELPGLAFPVQSLGHNGHPVLAEHDLGGLPATARAARLAGLAAAQSERALDLAAGPLLSAALLRLGAERGVLLLDIPALCADAVSLDRLVVELAAAYRAWLGGGAAGEEPPLQYADAAELFNELEGGAGEGACGGLELPQLPEARLPFERHAAVGPFRPRRVAVSLDPAAAAGLDALARRGGPDLEALLLACWLACLERLTGQPALCGVACAGRTYQGMDRALGPYLRYLPLACRPAPEWRFAELAAQVAAGLARLRAVQDALTWERAAAAAPHLPLFPAFAFRLEQPSPAQRAGELVFSAHRRYACCERWHLELVARREGESLRLELQFDAALLPRGEVLRLAGQLATLCASAAAAPERRLDELALASAAERHALLVEANDTRVDGQASPLLHLPFEAQARRTPAAVAATLDERQLTYGELEARANRLARRLARLGVGPEAPVALCLERSLDLVVALLAVLKAGGAYVPLDPSYPAPRLALMLDEARPAVLLTQRRLVDRLPAAAAVCLVLDDAAAALADETAESLPCRALPENLAYVLFTSGSTGRPKGVMVAHRAIAHHMAWMQAEYPLTAADRLLQKTPLSFDASVWEFYAPLQVGGRLVLAPPEGHREPAYLVRTVAEQRITVLQVVPTLLRLLLDEPGFDRALPLRRVFCGGEALTAELHDRFRAAFDCELVNVYGPSEATIHSSSWSQGRDADTLTVPIGRPIANTRLYLVDRRLEPLPHGAVGELCVAGAGLARGYLGRPAATAEAFLPDPFAGETGARLYRTGDLARARSGGEIEFLGRRDHQLKVRGARVELGEIEAVLRRAAGVRDAAVVAREDGGEARVVAYVVPAGGAAEGVEPLREFLRARLPEYMLPAQLVPLAALPLTPSGKVDRRALPEPERGRPRLGTPYVAPRTPAEARMAAAWEELLGVERVGVDDDFLALGGHSLLATRLIARVRELFAVALPLRSLFTAPTVAGLTALALRAEAIAPGGEAPRLRPAPHDRYQPFPLTPVQQAYWVGRREDVELGGVASHEYLEVDIAGLDVGRLERAWRRLVERHDMLRVVVRPDGRQQVLAAVPPYRVRVVDLAGLPAAACRRVREELRARLSHQTFATDRWPLFELCVSRDAEGVPDRLHLSLDLLICDARSLQVLAGELCRLYADPRPPLPALEITFRDYLLAAASRPEDEASRRARDYWSERLPQLPPAPQLPLARRPAAPGPPRFARRSGRLEAARWRRLQERAQRRGLTPPGVLLAAYAEIVAAWSRSRHFTLNLPVANRLPLHPQCDELVGDFTTLGLLEVDFRAREPFERRARRLQERLWEDLDHRGVDGLSLVRELARSRGRTGALVPVVFTSTLGFAGEDASQTLARLGTVVYRLTQTPQVWLDHLVSEVGGALCLDWDAVDALFPPGLLDAMFASYLDLLARLADGDEAWGETPRSLLPAAQAARRAAVNATAAPLSDELLHGLFARQALRHPERIAVAAADRRLSYGELLHRSLALGARLRAAGARPGALVAIVLEKGWEQVVATLAVLWSGAAYLPLDPELPPARLAELLERGGVRLALTRAGAGADPAWPSGVECVHVPDQESESGESLSPVQGPDDLAYVLFTSGSTGAPKGVMIAHRGPVNAILDTNRRFAVGPADRVLALTALHHDLSVYDLFGLLAAGGTVVVPSPEGARDPALWSELMRREGITLWNSVPARMQMLVEHLEDRPAAAPGALRLALRLAFLGGDWIPVTLPDRARRLLPGLEVVSVGGPTETSLWNIVHPVGEVPVEWASIPYGRPIANARYHVLDETLADCPDWVAGELYAAGVGLARGYWQDEEGTRSRFLAHPETGERLFRTGDLGRYLPDGTIEFLGRADQQVKLHGERIEPGEIEAALLRHPEVREAVVTVQGEGDGRRLVAFVVAAGDGADERLAQGERIEFKLARHGLRQDLAGRPEQSLLTAAANGHCRAAALARRSHRRFLATPVPFASLSGLLGALAQLQLDAAPLPKYRYPSAGGLYPVQVYLQAQPGRVEGVERGLYLYDPGAHRLARVGSDCVLDRRRHVPINRTIFDQAAFSLLLVGQLAAIEPAYGGRARDFCLLEAGAMGQLLMSEAAALGLGLCPVGKLDGAPLRAALALADSEVVLHSFLGGAVDAAAGVESWLRDAAEAAAAGTAAVAAGELDAELRSWLRQRLPGHMVPAAFVRLERLPHNANGKVDRGRLAALPAARPPAVGGVPRSRLQKAIAAAWRQVLGVEAIGLDDHFFDLGGNSLHLVQVNRELRRRLGLELPVGELFRFPTVSALAEHLGPRQEEAAVAAEVEERLEKRRRWSGPRGRPDRG